MIDRWATPIWQFVVRLRVLPGQREPALPARALRHPSQP